jgi:CheY-like chemotaxis protein
MDSNCKEILCLGKDEFTLQVRQMLFEHFGYKVVTAESVGEMHAILRRGCSDLLLLDTSDPELDCQEIAGKAKSICPDILSVVLTPDYGGQAHGYGSIDHFLQLDGPREEWLSGIQSLFARHCRGRSSASSAVM